MKGKTGKGHVADGTVQDSALIDSQQSPSPEVSQESTDPRVKSYEDQES